MLMSISVAPSAATLRSGVTQQLTVTGHYDDSSTSVLTTGLAFASADAELASVDTEGLVTAGTMVGSTVVTATHTDTDLNDTSDIAVTVAVVVFDPSQITMTVGASRFLRVYGLFSDSTYITLRTGLTFENLNPELISVDPVTGWTEALAPGTAYVTVTDSVTGLSNGMPVYVEALPITTNIFVFGRNTTPSTGNGSLTVNHGSYWGRLSGIPLGSWDDAAYGDHTVVAVGVGGLGGFGGVTEDPNKPAFITSKDNEGGSWEMYQWSAGLPIDGSVLSVAYGNGVFVAVGERRFADVTTALPCAWVSVDGYRWNEPVVIHDKNGLDAWAGGADIFACAMQIVWVQSMGKFVAYVSDGYALGKAYFATSTDGAAWTTVEISADRGPDLYGYGGLATDGTTVVFLDFGGSPWTSTDGSAWTHRTQGNNPGMPVYYLGYGGGKFLWPGDGTFHEYYSTDSGVTWEIGTGALQSELGAYTDIVFDGTHFHLTGSGTDDGGVNWWMKQAVSTTGLSWTESLVKSAGGQLSPFAIVYNGIVT